MVFYLHDPVTVTSLHAKWLGFYGVMVSTLDSESSDPSSNLGRTCVWFKIMICQVFASLLILQ